MVTFEFPRKLQKLIPTLNKDFVWHMKLLAPLNMQNLEAKSRTARNLRLYSGKASPLYSL